MLPFSLLACFLSILKLTEGLTMFLYEMIWYTPAFIKTINLPFFIFLIMEMSFSFFTLLCSYDVCLWSIPCLHFHIPVWTSKARHIQINLEGYKFRRQTETNFCVRCWLTSDISMLDQDEGSLSSFEVRVGSALCRSHQMEPWTESLNTLKNLSGFFCFYKKGVGEFGFFVVFFLETAYS